MSRKLLPAMGITLAGFVVARVLVAWLGRPRYQEPIERRISVVTDRLPNELHGEWNLSSGVYDASGRQIVANGNRYCPPEALANDRAGCQVRPREPVVFKLDVYYNLPAGSGPTSGSRPGSSPCSRPRCWPSPSPGPEPHLVKCLESETDPVAR